MKIQPITTFKINYNQQNQTIKQSPVKENQTTYATLPSTKQYLAFTGGYSINLAETVKNLDNLATKTGKSVFPPQIREWAGMVLDEGNKAKDTLISIHKKYFASLKDCFTLDEVKDKFPEFKDVLSDKDVEFSKESFVNKVKKGENDYFDKDEDMSLQLLKLYWAEGFSLNDLKKYTGGLDLYHTIKKLHIPTANKDYGHILKFSDPEYNERLTREMTAKRLEALEKKFQQETGEPVYIKRGPLSEEHKQHISEGLLKYYAENPQAIFNMSERQRQYYEDNPEQIKVFHKVMKMAWSVFNAKGIKDALSKFMKHNGEKEFNTNFLEQPETLSNHQSALMKKFWGTNEWAKKAFSKNMTYAWKKVKEEKNMCIKIDITPNRFKQKFLGWAQKNGIDVNKFDFETKYYPHNQELNKNNEDLNYVSQFTGKFIDSCKGDESQKLANSYQLSLMKFGSYLKTLEHSKESAETKSLATMLRYLLKETLFDSDIKLLAFTQPKVFDSQEIQKVYVNVLTILLDENQRPLAKQLNKFLNESYDYMDTNWTAGDPYPLKASYLNF
ncbi:MAG: hypothetical protein LKG27_04680 [Clostridiaceae bacterium]|jgi:hypothetical protein|nr:hypothetical protein [Clostridiaceae bacterium]